MCGARAGDLGAVLGGARNAGRVGYGDDRAAVFGDQGAQPVGGKHRIERDLRTAFRQSRNLGFERRRRAQVGKLRQIGLCLHRQLALVDEHEMRPFGREHGETERQRRVGHIAATDIEGPGKRGRVGQHGMRRAFLGDRRGKPRELVLGEFACELNGMDIDFGEWWRRSIGPQLIDRIGRERNEDRADLVSRGWSAP